MGERTYKQLNWTSRIKLETMLKHGHSKKEIAEELGVHISTIYRELKRGTYEHLNSDYTTEERYSPEKAEARYQEGLAAKGAPLKIGKNHAAAQFIEDKIGNEDYSPAAVCALLKQEKYKHFGITFCRATIYKYVEDGVFLTLTNQDLPEKGDRKKKHRTIRKKQARASSGTSIEQRPEYINERQEPGHWEMDTVVGKKRTKARLLVLSERVTRREIIIRIKDGRAETVVAALDRLERLYGAAFYRIFKTITVDNGSEFADADGIERSARHKDAKRTTVYYCHAYSSCERGTNENINRMIGYSFEISDHMKQLVRFNTVLLRHTQTGQLYKVGAELVLIHIDLIFRFSHFLIGFVAVIPDTFHCFSEGRNGCFRHYDRNRMTALNGNCGSSEQTLVEKLYLRRLFGIGHNTAGKLFEKRRRRHKD